MPICHPQIKHETGEHRIGFRIIVLDYMNTVPFYSISSTSYIHSLKSFPLAREIDSDGTKDGDDEVMVLNYSGPV